MIDTKNKFIVFKEIDWPVDNDDIQIVKQKDNIFSSVKKVIETRIRRDNASIYVGVPSRDIKKWFETRRI